jgi:hypothetical protein
VYEEGNAMVVYGDQVEQTRRLGDSHRASVQVSFGQTLSFVVFFEFHL